MQPKDSTAKNPSESPLFLTLFAALAGATVCPSHAAPQDRLPAAAAGSARAAARGAAAAAARGLQIHHHAALVQ